MSLNNGREGNGFKSHSSKCNRGPKRLRVRHLRQMRKTEKETRATQRFYELLFDSLPDT